MATSDKPEPHRPHSDSGSATAIAAEVALTKTSKARLSFSDSLFRMFFSAIAPERYAKAQTAAALSERLANGPLTDVELQTLDYLVGREKRRLETLSQIAAKAQAALPPGNPVIQGTPPTIDPDWLVRFAEDSQDVVSEALQAVYAAILARVALYPGSISRETLGVVRYLDADTAKIFDRMRSVALRSARIDFFLPFDSSASSIYAELAVDYQSLLALDAAGLIRTTRRGIPLEKKPDAPETAVFECGSTPIEVTIPDVVMQGVLGYPLTRAGAELLHLLPIVPHSRLREVLAAAIVVSPGQPPRRRRHPIHSRMAMSPEE